MLNINGSLKSRKFSSGYVLASNEDFRLATSNGDIG